jgi:hypothetical protein
MFLVIRFTFTYISWIILIKNRWWWSISVYFRFPILYILVFLKCFRHISTFDVILFSIKCTFYKLPFEHLSILLIVVFYQMFFDVMSCITLNHSRRQNRFSALKTMMISTTLVLIMQYNLIKNSTNEENKFNKKVNVHYMYLHFYIQHINITLLQHKLVC